ncbi:putative defense protein Hdd11-like [Ornithodoros turicata]|uniref:putative defense protein Hdd11-like n=1 Tax=Ornithodoros turicata TaxID=34597 RepID=UPI0031398BBE
MPRLTDEEEDLMLRVPPLRIPKTIFWMLAMVLKRASWFHDFLSGKRKHGTTFTLALVFFVGEIKAHGYGAPPNACEKMTPHHLENQSYNATTPGVTFYKPTPSINNLYKLEASYSADTKQVAVSLTAVPGNKFRGFFIRSVNAKKMDQFVNGVFSAFNQTVAQTVDCDKSQGSGITHRSKEEKEKFTAAWKTTTAPCAAPLALLFRATVARDRPEFTTEIKSPQLDIDCPPGSSTESSTTTTKPASEKKSAALRLRLPSFEFVLCFLWINSV